MSIENGKKFYEAIAADENLRQRLAALSQSYAAETLDEAKLLQLAENEVLPIAAERGLPFTLAEFRQYAAEQYQTQAGHDLSDEELAAVTGGEGWCVIIGVGGAEGCFCLVGGYAAHNLNSGTCILYGEFHKH